MCTGMLRAQRKPHFRLAEVDLVRSPPSIPLHCRQIEHRAFWYRPRMMRKNHRFTLAARPVGLPKPTDFAFEEQDLREPGDGEFVVTVQYISLDPAMRGWMNEGKSYVRPVATGELMRAMAIGSVIESKHPRFTVGTHVAGVFGLQEYTISNGEGLMPIDPTLAPLPVMLGTLGMPGLTAYFGLLDIGKPVAGNTVVVSG